MQVPSHGLLTRRRQIKGRGIGKNAWRQESQKTAPENALPTEAGLQPWQEGDRGRVLTTQALTTFDLFASIPVNRVKKYEIMHMPDDEPISEAPLNWAFDKRLGMEMPVDLHKTHKINLDHLRL